VDSKVSVPWEVLLVGYLSGSSDFDPLYSAAYKPFLRIVARIARFMPDDIREEAVGQAFLRLLAKPPKYDQLKCKPRSFAYGLLQNAVRQVQAMYTPPGRKTRGESELAADKSEQTANAIEADNQTIAEDRRAPGDLEQVPTTRWSPSTIQALAEASHVLGQMPRDVAVTAWLVYGLEFSITEAARKLSKSRFAVARSLTQARNQVRRLAA
jgi:DNA-directed RNA polymerase specialized sigma24 family protein